MNAWTISETVFLLLLYLVGVCIQYKVTAVCWKDKEGKTWMIHMTNSICTILYFGFYIPFFILTNEIPNLAERYTGEWFCYVATFVTIFGMTIITFNSLLIAVMKYTFIVQHQRVLEYGEKRVKKLFFIINLSVPFFLSLFACLMRDFDAYGALNSCFGMTEHIKQEYNTWPKSYSKFFLCDWIKGEEYRYGYAFFIFKQTICAIKSTAVAVINTNLPEAFFYYKIFKKMKW